MKCSLFNTALLGAISSIALIASPVLAQYQNKPFIDGTVQQSQARAFELAGLRLDIAEALQGETDDEFIEQIEGLEGDFARFGGTLATANAELAEELDAAFEAVVPTVQSGSDAKADIDEARTLLADAYATVIAPDVQATPAFKAAVLADLLLGEPGVAEGYEEAGEEPYAFSLGWAALARANVLWDEISADADTAPKADGDEMLAFIGTLYPSAEPPEQFTGNPEEAEAPAQRLVGIIETMVDADLYPGRDQASLATHLASLTGPACQAYAAGNDAVADETIYAVQGHYADHLGELTNLFDPELHERVQSLFGSMVQVEDDDEEAEGDEADVSADAQDDEAEDEAVEPGSAADSCTELTEALGQVRSVLGG
ncbi:hypothetical protein [Devosia rhizoryzae]|uniref:Imelysin-like domain-containing protein n=1 Tax=Devosia rhizoryzae TaxID=2774137 RepID=A0ABX7C6X4_9HYPH|nr:hypothetical protein [Devosia rhizoryzae]QQR40009.1 hypothetical protein JI748_03045 [Devosia rhizoryzae]